MISDLPTLVMPKGPLQTVCAWCGAVIGEGALVDGRPSHGICLACLEVMVANLTTPRRESVGPNVGQALDAQSTNVGQTYSDPEYRSRDRTKISL